MKLGKTSLVLLMIGVTVIMFGSLGIARSQQKEEQGQLYQELAVTELRLGKLDIEGLSLQQTELERQLGQIRSELEATRAMLSPQIGGITTNDNLLEIARSSGVEITEITSSEMLVKGLGKIACSVLPLSVRVEGDTAGIVTFVTGLNQYFTTGVIESVEMRIPEAAEGEESATPSASIRLAVYTHKDN